MQKGQVQQWPSVSKLCNSIKDKNLESLFSTTKDKVSLPKTTQLWHGVPLSVKCVNSSRKHGILSYISWEWGR